MSKGGSGQTHKARLVVWRFVDGKAGHENQSGGLLRALAAHRELDVYELRAAGAWLLDWLRGRFPPGAALPAPALLVGAGSATHMAMLAARRARGGRIIVLMKPSLPLAWFDLCLIPRHDSPPARGNVLATSGVLNRIERGVAGESEAGLILLGGPSAHYGWDEANLLTQIETISSRDPRRWVVASSRRTPDSTLHGLRRTPELTLVPWQDTGPDWLPAQLRRASRVWVSEDSVSMLYEALTSGAACGLLPVPRRRDNRLSHGLEQLRQERMITTYPEWLQGAELSPPARPFDEARRCADWIASQWLPQ